MAEVYLFTIYIYVGTLTILTLCHTVFTVNRIAELLTTPREKPVAGKVSLHRRIGNRELIIIIQFNSVSIKCDVYEIVVLLIVCKADSNRRDNRGILECPLRKVNILHDFLAAQRHTLWFKPKFSCDQLVKSLDFPTPAYNKYRAR